GGDADLEVLPYALVLGVVPGTKLLSGGATLTLRGVRPVTALTLDFGHWYTVDAASVNGTTGTAMLSPADKITVSATLAADATATLVVRYHGQPHEIRMPSSRPDATEGLGLRAERNGEAWTMQE